MKTRAEYARDWLNKGNNRAKVRAYAKEHIRERKAWIASLKDLPCTDCGNKFPPECMDFDHVKGEKKFGIAAGATHAKAKF